MTERVIYLGRRIHLTAVLNESLRRQDYSFPRGAGKPLFMSGYWCAVHQLKNALSSRPNPGSVFLPGGVERSPCFGQWLDEAFV